ncbi:MAG: putative peptidoglycan glycosyltransferase FtsW [Chlorobium phaeovibrioides]|nr:putative peptidoglycan glycosyltransferase FtsW [Chlorobium phaeovibrioides]
MRQQPGGVMDTFATSRGGAIAGKMLLLIVAALMCIGIVVVYSSGAGWAETKFSNREYFLYRHLVFTVAGIGVVLGVARIDYHLFRKVSKLFLMVAIGILLLLLLLKAVGVIHGAARWIGIGPVKFQASDLAKYALIFHISRLLEEKQSYIKEWSSSFLPMLLLLVTVVVLVALEPNFSTASLIGIIGLTLMFIGGVSLRHLGVTLLSILPVAVAYAMSAPYRMARLTSFFTSDEKKLSYQVVQALIGLGNGGLRGLGMGESKQRELYLPLSYNDFVFVVIGEEYGFIGAVVVLLLFAALLVCGIIIAKNAPDAFGRYVAAGISVAITLFAFINIAVACHLIPTTGVALPFISYGGTALLANSLGVGILVSISGHRKRAMKKGKAELEHIMEERER